MWQSRVEIIPLCISTMSQRSKRCSAARMSSALKGSFVLQHFEHSNTVELHSRIMFDFYPGLPHIHRQFSGFTTNVCQFALIIHNVHATLQNIFFIRQCRVWKESCNVQVEIFWNKCKKKQGRNRESAKHRIRNNGIVEWRNNFQLKWVCLVTLSSEVALPLLSASGLV